MMGTVLGVHRKLNHLLKFNEPVRRRRIRTAQFQFAIWFLDWAQYVGDAERGRMAVQRIMLEALQMVQTC